MHHPKNTAQTSVETTGLFRRFGAHELSIGFIILLPFVLFWRWVFKGEVLFWGTPLFQFWPWHHLATTSALAGEWPLWNPFLGNGTPLLANLQTAFFYPLNLLYFLLPVEHGLTGSVMIHLLLAGLFMYIYTRYIGLSPFAAAISAMTYMFSGYLIGRTQFVTMINAAAWFPILLLLGEKLATQRNTSYVLWLGLALAIQLLAGHAQLWFYGLWLIGAYILVRSWQEAGQQVKPQTNQEAVENTQTQTKRVQRGLAMARAGWKFGLAVGIAILLSAVQIVPTAEFAMQSPRQSGAERLFALSYSFWPWRLITLIAPNFFGNPAQGNYWGYANYWEDHAYVGVLPFVLAILAIWYYLKRGLRQHNRHQTSTSSLRLPTFQRVVPFFAIVIPVSLVLAMGWNTPLYLWLFDTVPGFGYFQAPARLLIWYTLAITVLAGVGVQTFELNSQNRPGLRRFLVVCLGITVAGVVGRFYLSGRSLTFLVATLMLGLLLTLSIIILLSRPSQKTTTQGKDILWQFVMLTFVTFDLLWFALPLIRTLPTTIFTQPIASAEFLKSRPGDTRFFIDDQFDHTTKFDQYFRFDTFGPLQVEYWQGFKETLVPNLGVYAGLPAVNNDDPLVIGRWQQFSDLISSVVDPAHRARLLATMNAGYFVDSATDNVWPVIYEDETINIQRVPDVLPRAYFVSRAFQAQTTTEVLNKLTSPDFDPHREVIIMDTENTLDIENGPQRIAEARSVDVKEQGLNQVSLSVDAPTAGFVVLTDTFYPGWQATIDGQLTHIWPANLAFRVVAVKAGKHEIVFGYRPRSFSVGLWISIITLVIVVGTAGSKVVGDKLRSLENSAAGRGAWGVSPHFHYRCRTPVPSHSYENNKSTNCKSENLSSFFVIGGGPQVRDNSSVMSSRSSIITGSSQIRKSS